MKNLNVLIFHRLIDENEEKHELIPNTNSQNFYETIKRLKKFYKFTTPEKYLKRELTKKKFLKNISVTFDDGYKDNFLFALPIFKQMNIPATFFVSSGFLNGGWMWNDGIIEAISKTSKVQLDLTSIGFERFPLYTAAEKISCINDLISRIKYLETRTRVDMAKRILELASVAEPVHLMMTDEQVKEMHRAGMEIGGHTVNHPILKSADKATARREIFENKEYLESLIGEPIKSFAYPNGKPGKDYGPEHVALVKEAGYKCAVSTAWGRVNMGSDPFQLPRFTPWDRNPWKFILRLWLLPHEKGGRLEC